MGLVINISIYIVVVAIADMVVGACIAVDIVLGAGISESMCGCIMVDMVVDSGLGDARRASIY